MTKAQVYIFAKAPRLGQVKTRLAAGIGAERALAFYTETLSSICARLTVPDWNLAIALTPDDCDERMFGVEAEAQGGGDLGERLLRFLTRARPSAPAIVVGSDIPDMDAIHVGRAVDALDQADLAFGPSGDGGFWLIGASHPPAPTLFNAVRWSSRHALADTLANASDCDVRLVDRLDDVDDADAFHRRVQPLQDAPPRTQNLAQ